MMYCRFRKLFDKCCGAEYISWVPGMPISFIAACFRKGRVGILDGSISVSTVSVEIFNGDLRILIREISFVLCGLWLNQV
jgi:hypothetical protein